MFGRRTTPSSPPPPTPKAARQRVAELLRAHPADDHWQRRAVDLAERTTRGSLYQLHPALRRLHELQQGWLHKPRNLRLADRYPALADVALDESINLELNTDNILDQPGPESDFDPRNSVPFASVLHESVWFSLLCLPDEPIERWPVIECEPAGPVNVVPVALDADHFIHQWMCRDGPYTLSPLRSAEPDAAGDIIRVMHHAFGIHAADARLALKLGLDDATAPARLQPYVPDSILAPLLALAVLPDDA